MLEYKKDDEYQKTDQKKTFKKALIMKGYKCEIRRKVETIVDIEFTAIDHDIDDKPEGSVL